MNLSGAKRRLYVRKRELWEQACNKSRFSGRVLTAAEISGGILLPPKFYDERTGEFSGGVADANFNFVSGLQRNAPGEAAGFYGVGKSYPAPPKSLEYCDKAVIFGGILIGHFGHFLLEGMGRLWYVLKHRDDPRPLAFLIELGRREYFFDFLDLLDIPREKIIIIEKATAFRSVLVPDEAAHSWSDYSADYMLPYRYIVERVGHPPAAEPYAGKKIYLTRSKLNASQTHCCNEEYFEKFFTDNGFTVLSLEKLPLAAQIAVINRAAELAALMGSLTHWAIFAAAGTKFAMLTRTAEEVLETQCLINEASSVDWRIVDVSMNLLPSARDFGVCLVGATEYWREYARENFGAVVDDDSWKYAYHDYLLRWTDYYLNPDYRGIIEGLDLSKIIKRLNRQLYQNEPPAKAEERRRGRPFLLYQVRMLKGGLLEPTSEDHTAGYIDDDDAIVAFRVFFSTPGQQLSYAAYSPMSGWSADSQVNQTAAAKGGAEIYGLEIALVDDSTDLILEFRVHAYGKGWSDWASGGKNVVSADKPLNALEIRLVKKT